MSRSYTYSPQAPSWRVDGLLYFTFTFQEKSMFYGPGNMVNLPVNSNNCQSKTRINCSENQVLLITSRICFQHETYHTY
jgi:hypothetical protein